MGLINPKSPCFVISLWWRCWIAGTKFCFIIFWLLISVFIQKRENSRANIKWLVHIRPIINYVKNYKNIMYSSRKWLFNKCYNKLTKKIKWTLKIQAYSEISEDFKNPFTPYFILTSKFWNLYQVWLGHCPKRIITFQ